MCCHYMELTLCDYQDLAVLILFLNLGMLGSSPPHCKQQNHSVSAVCTLHCACVP